MLQADPQQCKIPTLPSSFLGNTSWAAPGSWRARMAAGSIALITELLPSLSLPRAEFQALEGSLQRPELANSLLFQVTSSKDFLIQI